MAAKIPFLDDKEKAEELKRKLISLLAEEKAIALSTDKKAGEHLLDELKKSHRRLTIYEAHFIEGLWADYFQRRQR